MTAQTKTRTTSLLPFGEARLADLPRAVVERAQTLPKDVAAAGREAWLLGLGAIATVEEEGETLYDSVVKGSERLTRRGTQLEKRGRARLEALREDAAARQQALGETVESTVVEPVMRTLQRLGVPTRGEVRELAGKVDLLTRRVNALISRLDANATVAPALPVFVVRAREDGWEVALEGDDRPVAVHATKDEAVDRGREIATEQAPSQLVVYKKDGTIQDTFTYDA